jgi:metallopeptidase MepB
VRILFHELGHAIHHLVSRTKYATKHSRDFGEIPSNMLEHFIWIPEVMSRLSRYYKTLPDFKPKGEGDNPGDIAEGTTIPMNLARAMARTKTLNKATGLLGLMQPALFDLTIYSPKTSEEAKSMDTTAMWNKLSCQYLPYHFPENESMFGHASFSPHFRGTDVGYFKYIM